MKKSISVVMALVLMMCTLAVGYAATETSAKLYPFYGDSMVFRQQKEAVLAGTAAPGSRITAELTDSKGTIIRKAEAVTPENGVFEVGFTAPAGGFEEYSISLYENGRLSDRLSGVVFGEVWLASGQSNMEYVLAADINWPQMCEAGDFGTQNVRFLYVPSIPEGGMTATPRETLSGCMWIKGGTNEIGCVSAVAYYFANKLAEDINMPVGIISNALGGSYISTWISKAKIDSDEVATNYLRRINRYHTETDYISGDITPTNGMCGNYNVKIYPLRRFKLSGMIWYQGETDLFSNCNYGEYGEMIKLLQEENTETFGYDDGLLPFIFTNIASYNYPDSIRAEQDFNAEFADIQNALPESRALSTISDVSLSFLGAGSIHPNTKQPVGERMAVCAENLVYGGEGEYTSAVVDKVSIKENAVEVTFKNVGSGLICDGKVLKDFAVCGKDGIYYKAEAEIISADTIRIHSDLVENPVSATYAISIVNNRANLWSGNNGEKFMPVCPFITDRNYSGNYYYEMPWTDCDSNQFWRLATNDSSIGEYDIWQTENCSAAVSEDAAYKGDGGLSVTSVNRSFSVYERFYLENGRNDIEFTEESTDWSRYKTLSFRVRNNGSKDIKLKSVAISVGNITQACPTVNGEDEIGCTIPADGEWHEVVLNLNRMYLFGNAQAFCVKAEKLKDVKELKLNFTSDGAADMDIDEFDFGITEPEQKTEIHLVSIKLIVTIFAFFRTIISRIPGC